MLNVRVYVKKQISIAHLSFNQTQMLKLGTVGLATVKNRVQAVKDGNDAQSPPLTTKYARRKSRVTRRAAVRDLTYSGKMLNNLQVRTVSDQVAYASLSTRADRKKALFHTEFFRQRTGSGWLVFSPTSIRDTAKAAYQIFQETLRYMVKQRPGG